MCVLRGSRLLAPRAWLVREAGAGAGEARVPEGGGGVTMRQYRRDRAAQILNVIVAFTDAYGHPPSVREIASRVGLAGPAAVHYHLGRLMYAGQIRPCPCGCGIAWPADEAAA